MHPFDPHSQVLFEDNHLLVVNKLPSQIVQGDKTGDEPMSESIKLYLKEKYDKPGNVFLGVVHRLDRPVSGLVIFAKTSKALARLNRQVADREIRKTYWAVVGNRPPAIDGRLVDYLVKDEAKNKSFVVSKHGKSAREAVLEYRLVASSDRYHLLEVNLETGRHHQIRVQLAHMGCPIKGDLKYGFPRSNPGGFIHLHARELEFSHPVKGDRMAFTAEPPADAVWGCFAGIPS